MNTPQSQELLLISALCVPDIPLPLKLLRESLGWQSEQFNQAQETLITDQQWIQLPGIGVLLPVQVWTSRHSEPAIGQTAQFINAALKEAQNAMAHHSRLAQLAAIREIGPHLYHFAEQAEALELNESPLLWQVLGDYLQAVGKSAEAVDCFKRSLNSSLAPGSAEWQIEIHQQLGKACQSARAYTQSEQAYQIACTMGRAQYGENDARLATLVENLGQLAFQQNQYASAIQYYQQALAIDQAAQSGANRIASRWNNLGRVHQAAGDLPVALDCFQQAAALWQSDGVSEHHANQALALKNMGMVYQEMGELQQAKQSLEAAIRCSEEFYGKDHPDIGRDAGLLAGILQALGEYEDALALFRRAVQIDIRSFGQNHPEVALNINNLGVLLAQMGKINDALETLQEALRILQQCAPLDHPYRRQVEDNIRGLQCASNSIQSSHVSNDS